MPGCKLCRRTLSTGCTCKASATRGSAYCYYHHGPQKPDRALQPKESAFEIEPVSEPSSIPLAAGQVPRAAPSPGLVWDSFLEDCPMERIAAYRQLTDRAAPAKSPVT